ncbi:MAG TPA: SDR family oxidoreductase [Jatrophihabitantaceae bacterium]|nr:SDR family oxidoreductase [Jatrophihabitantaceae bacterium]
MAKVQRSLSGKLVFITGAARGIGRATAAMLVGEGARVVIGDLDQNLAEQTAAELGRGTIGLKLDVTDHAEFTAVLDRVEAEHGPLDVLINNAGIMPLVMFEDETLESAQRQIAVNFLAPWHGTQDAIRRMKPRARGHIVNVASMAGVVPTPGAATYSATKHALVGLCESVSWELRGSGVDFSYVLPALVNTQLADGIKRTRATRVIEPETVAAEIVKALKNPKLAVYVPPSMNAITKWSGLLPRRIGDKLMTGTGSDHVLSDAMVSGQRDDYEKRVSESAPGAERTG